MREEIIGDARLILGDCREVLPTLSGVNAVITSPPYGEQRIYEFVEMPNWRDLVSKTLATMPFDDAQVIVNLGLIHSDGEVKQYWNDLIADMNGAGWRLFGWYVWDKMAGLPGNWNGRLAPAHEWVFHFNRKPFQANKCFSCKYAGIDSTKGNSGLRKANGKTSGWSQMGKVTQEMKISDSVIRCIPQKARNGPEKDHPAVYPVEFAQVLIESYSNENDTIVDPFMGSGTTGVAAAKLFRKFIGIEISEKYFEIAVKRLRAIYENPQFFHARTVPPPSKPIQQSLLTGDKP